jgi:hypothetical protein
VSAFSGSSAYQFLILSGLVILLGAALARRGSGALRGTDRWAIAAGMLVGLQGLRLITSLWAPASVYLPLLDRLFSVLLPSLLGWAALGPEAGERADRILTGIVVVAATMFAGSVFLAATPSDFNTSFFDEIWSLAALAAAGGALLAVVTRRPPQWGVFSGALAVLVAGDLAHIVTIPFTASSAPYVLLAEDWRCRCSPWERCGVSCASRSHRIPALHRTRPSQRRKAYRRSWSWRRPNRPTPTPPC